MCGKGGKRDPKKEVDPEHIATTFKPAHIKRLIKQQSKMRVSRDTLRACSAAITYIMLEIMDGGRSCCQCDGKKKMSPRHINAAITSDAELHSLFKDYVIQAGGGRQFKVPESKNAN